MNASSRHNLLSISFKPLVTGKGKENGISSGRERLQLTILYFTIQLVGKQNTLKKSTTGYESSVLPITVIKAKKQ